MENFRRPIKSSFGNPSRQGLDSVIFIEIIRSKKRRDTKKENLLKNISTEKNEGKVYLGVENASCWFSARRNYFSRTQSAVHR